MIMPKTMPNFLELPPTLCDFATSKAAIVAIPYEATTSYGKGTAGGPEAIIQASTQVEFYDEELDWEPCRIGISTLRPFDAFPAKPEHAVKQITAGCSELLREDKFIVGLGGEHTVTVGLVAAMKAKYPDLCVLQLDAHSDLRDQYQGSAYSHACVMARILEICPYVGLGIRSSIPGQDAKISPSSHLLYAHEMYRNHNWADWVLRRLGDPVYVTIDLDFFDPSLLPAVGTPEPGGFQWHETLAFLKEIARHRTVIGFDVVELSPKPGWPASDFAAAKLIYKMIGYVFAREMPNTKKKNLDY